MLTFFFTDLEGSSGKWEAYPLEMADSLARHDALMAEVVSRIGGRIFKSTGDGVYAVFADTSQAMTAAVTVQVEMQAAAFSVPGGLSARIALHRGTAEERDGDFFGPAINRTARLTGLGHGGQILLSAAAAEAAEATHLPPGSGLRSLGGHRLRDLLLPEAVFQLIAPNLREDFPPLRVTGGVRSNLPLQTTSLIGREAELAALHGLMAEHRLITLLGPGGIGKTRLSLQAAATLSREPADGTWLVELAGLADGAQVVEAIASAFGIRLGDTGIAEQNLAAALFRIKALLVLDNCEHVAAAAAAAIAALLGRCPGLTILASSRMPLGVAGEQFYQVPSLALPPSEAAVKLFIDRARLVKLNFSLNPENTEAVHEICRRLDGLPFAIELAAARIRVMRPAELLAGMKDRFRLLRGGSRNALPRQQTLRALFDWSFALLDETERIGFSQLSVFAGGFSAASAETLIAGGPVDPVLGSDLIFGLIDKSLIAEMPQDSKATRFHLLETAREYAAEKLAEAGETAAVRRRHALLMVDLFSDARQCWPDTDAQDWRAAIEPEIDNLRSALDWSFSQDGDPAIAVALVARIAFLVMDNLLTWREATPLIEAAIALLAPDILAEDEAWLWFCAARAEALTGRLAGMNAGARAILLFQSLGDSGNAAYIETMLAFTSRQAGDLARAEACIAQARLSLPKISHNRLRSMLLGNLAAALDPANADAEEIAVARQHHEQAIAIHQQFRYHTGVAIARLNLAVMEGNLGNREAAIRAADKAAADCRTLRIWPVLGQVLANLAAQKILLGDHNGARAAGREACPLLIDLHDRLSGTNCALSLALLAAQTGDLQAAARLTGFAEHFFIANKFARGIAVQSIWSALETAFDRAEAQDVLPEPTRIRLIAEGAALPLEEALHLAMTV